MRMQRIPGLYLSQTGAGAKVTITLAGVHRHLTWDSHETFMHWSILSTGTWLEIRMRPLCTSQLFPLRRKIFWKIFFFSPPERKPTFQKEGFELAFIFSLVLFINWVENDINKDSFATKDLFYFSVSSSLTHQMLFPSPSEYLLHKRFMPNEDQSRK